MFSTPPPSGRSTLGHPSGAGNYSPLDLLAIECEVRGKGMAHKVDESPTAVLLVEDDELVKLVANDILAEAGFRVIEARNAREALMILESQPNIRIVFTDWNMPGELDGLGLALQVHERWPQVAVLVTSGKMYPMPSQLPQGVRFIAKPYRPSALVDEVKQMLSRVIGIEQGASVMPEGIVMHSPVTAEIGGQGIAAAIPEPDKS